MQWGRGLYQAGIQRAEETGACGGLQEEGLQKEVAQRRHFSSWCFGGWWE